MFTTHTTHHVHDCSMHGPFQHHHCVTVSIRLLGQSPSIHLLVSFIVCPVKNCRDHMIFGFSLAVILSIRLVYVSLYTIVPSDRVKYLFPVGHVSLVSTTVFTSGSNHRNFLSARVPRLSRLQYSMYVSRCLKLR